MAEEITIETFEHKVGDTVHKIPVMAGDVNIKELLGKAAGAARKEAEARLKEKYAPLESALSDKTLTAQQLQEKIDAFELEKLSAEDRVKKQYENEMKKRDQAIKDANDIATKNLNLFRENKIQNDIHAALSGFNLFNPEQTMLMMRHVGKADLVEADGSYKTVFRVSENGVESELTPKDFAAKFLALPEYANQIKNNLIAGGGTGSGSGSRSPSGSLLFKRSEMAASAAVRAEYTKAKAANPAGVEIIDA